MTSILQRSTEVAEMETTPIFQGVVRWTELVGKFEEVSTKHAVHSVQLTIHHAEIVIR